MFIKTNEQERVYLEAAEKIYSYVSEVLRYAYCADEVPAELLDLISLETDNFLFKYGRRAATAPTKEETVLKKQEIPDRAILAALQKYTAYQDKFCACVLAYNLGLMHGKRAERARRGAQKPILG